ncbi:glycosyltransferase [Tumebacillus sp. DT12]|uniref:Glycosyltransferase n=1 Tax=Tumebacillus lacus TaxID=2995335 RepID=A0ABT3X1H7_9BACL|nr:glycosyltransferase [Tumebacillus lacus]MCX7569466.1 glycosyltransferase [Tumebacillus lacus]
MRKHTISLCMIIKNEEKQLENCLNSVREAVDEMIVVDTGSTDASVKIAERMGAKVLHFDWIDDFAAARNFSLQQATSDYILVLDADETLDRDADLTRVVMTEQDIVYLLRIRNLSGGAERSHYAPRLFKNGAGIHYRGRIHEQLFLGDDQNVYQGHQTDLVIHHVGYEEDIYLEKDKHTRNFTLLKKAVEENRTGYNLFSLALQYRANGEYEQAFRTFSESFALSHDKEYLAPLLFYMGDCALQLGWYAEGIDIVSKAVNSFPAYTDLHFVLGRLYEEAGYEQDAELAYRHCLELGEVKTLQQTLTGVGSYLAHFRLAELCKRQGRFEEAMKESGQAVLESRFVPTLSLYLQLLRESGTDLSESEALMMEAFPLQDEQDLNALLGVAYTRKHPLLDRLITRFGVSVSVKDLAVSKLYAGQYAQSQDLWNSAELITKENEADLFVLAILTGQTDLLLRFKRQMNYSKREWDVLLRVATGAEPSALGTGMPALEALLLQTAEQLVALREFEAFERLADWVIQAPVALQAELARMLQAYGYAQVAFDILLRLYQQGTGQPDVLAQLGDLCLLHGNVEDALKLYAQLVQTAPVIAHYARFCRLYEQTGDRAALQRLAKELKVRFPLSQWAKQLGQV